jgi:hypothetical protein
MGLGERDMAQPGKSHPAVGSFLPNPFVVAQRAGGKEVDVLLK